MNLKEFKIYLLLIFVVFATLFLAAEITLIFLGYYYSPLRIEKLGHEVKGCKTDFRTFLSEKDEYFVFDPNLIWRPKKNYKIFNSQGFRGSEVNINKKNGCYYIFTIGDSNTLSPCSAPFWPEYLGKIIIHDYANVKVINAGIPGYTSFQGLDRFKEILRYKPDMVLVSFGANDAHRVTIADKDYVSSKRFFKSGIARLRLCQFFIAMADKIMIKSNENNLLVPRVGLKEYAYNLNQIITLANKNHTKVILLTRPFIGDSPNELWWKNFAPQYNQLTLKIGKERGILTVDIYSYFKEKGEYFVDESHFNDQGHRRAAEIIYNCIKENSKFNTPKEHS